MSQVAISGNASGTGTLTIAAPNTNSNYTLTLPTATTTFVGTDATQTLTNKTLGAGTASVPALLLTSGTNLTSATAGAVEYDGKVIYGTPLGTERGIVPTQQYYRLNSNLAGSNVTTAQNTFGVGVTLSASTVYEFESVFILSKSAGTTSHIPSILFGGSATLNNILYSAYAGAVASSTPSGTDTSPRIIVQNAASSIAISGAATSAALTLIAVLRGSVSVNAGGTFIPQYSLSAAPGGAYSTVAGSFIRIAPIGASGSAINVGTWA